MKDRVWKKKYLLPEFAVLFAAFIHHIWFMDKYVDRWLDGDLSAELVEGEILSKEWGIIAKDWMFSTELRVLNVPQVFSFIFHFTHDWHTVRILSAAVLVVILIFSVIFLAKSMGIKHYPLLGLIFALPFSVEYNNYVIYGLYYIPHIATVFLTAALVMQILNSDSKKKRAVLLVFAIVLSVLTGLGGPRLVLFLYIPLLIAVFVIYVSKKKMFTLSDYISVIAVSASGILGFLVNDKILHRIYMFQKHEINFGKFELINLSDFVAEVMRGFGYAEGQVDIYKLCGNFISLVILAAIIISFVDFKIQNANKASEFLYIYIVCALLTAALFSVAMKGEYLSARYLYPVTILLIPWAFSGIENFKSTDRWIKAVAVCCFYGALLLSSHRMYSIYKYSPKSDELPEVIEYLEDNGLSNGYSTWSTANPVTELSEGRIEMWVIEENLDYLNVLPWLQKKSHLTNHPAAPFFVVMSKYDDAYPVLWCLEEKPVFENSNYLVYVYQDHDEFMQKYGEKEGE